VALAGPDLDVAVIGGGPGGASAAAYLAKAGVSCAVFERETFPRPHVGESLVPSSTRVFAELGFLDTMESEGFLRKYGAAWTSAGSSQLRATDWKGLEADVQFAEREQPGVEQLYTYHVDRAKFDALLLSHAAALGATVHHGANVRGVDFTDPGMVRLHLVRDGREEQATARMVVDASGRRTLLGTQLRWRIKDPVFDQYALHTWFEGYDRSAFARKAAMCDYIFIHFLPMTNTWVWQIPISGEVTSVGVVTQRKHFANRRDSREAFFWDSVRSRPELGSNLAAARQLRPLKEEGDYSYAMRQLAGDRLVLVGDAGRFVDPIFSTGVSIAVNSARFATRDIVAALEAGDLRRERFHDFEATIGRGTRNWYRFISVYYRLNILFSAFIQDPRYRLDVLKLLQGDVYDEDEPAVLAEMRAIVTDVERDPRHPWHRLLGDLTANAYIGAYGAAS
jgi:flavin-dependent dehydrogenase